MKKWEVEFYEKTNGEIPIIDFLESLPVKMRAKADRELHILEEYGNALREPHTKQLESGLFELRIKFASDISRIFYFFVVGRKIILTNGFIKKTQKTPRQELEKARKYKLDYEERNA